MTGMQRLRSYLRRHWPSYLWGGVCLFVTATLVMMIPWWIRAAVSVIEQGGPAKDVVFYAVAIIGAAVVQGVVRTFSRFLIFNAGRAIEYELRNDIFAHLLKLPLSFYRSRMTGDLMSRAINDINSVRMLLGPGILNMINAPLYYLYAMVLMVQMDVSLTLVVILTYPIMAWAFRKFRGKIQKASLKLQQQMSVLSSHVQENLSGIQVVKAYVREQDQIHRFMELNQEYQARNMDMARLRGLVHPFMGTISGLTVLVVLWYGGVRVISGDLMIADVVAFIAYLNVLAWPTAAFGWMLALVERGRASMDRIEEIFRARPAIADPAQPVPLPRLGRGIEFRDVCFTYGGKTNGETVLKNISFDLPRGGKLGIVGRTGAGKTTLVQLIPRLYDVTSGEIRIDGEDIRRLALADLRRAVGYVPQDAFLFSTTLRNNLTYGSDGASKRAIEQAVKVARLDQDVESFIHGLDTIVGERGIAVSGGQKQRATLARALLFDSPFILLDDCLSSVDAETESAILQQFEDLSKGKTCIIVSHRISAVRSADEILVLDEGRVLQRGDHDSLVQEDGLYADLYRQQQLAEALERL